MAHNSARKSSSTAREALFKSAEKLFAERNYSAVSTRDIATDAGVNLGAIQYHFGSKAALFVETVRRMMSSDWCSRDFIRAVQAVPKSPDEAARSIIRFIALYLFELRSQAQPQVCRIMYREILGETSQDPQMFEALVSSVVDEFIRPVHQQLEAIVKQAARFDCTENVGYIVHSITGQCSFYFTHKPFIERLHGVDASDSKHFIATIEHISRFTLRALGWRNEEITPLLESELANLTLDIP